MFSKKNRLSREEFLYTFKAGKKMRLPFAQLIYTPAGDTFKAAVVVSKKVHKGAFRRNQLRRRFYHALRDIRNPEKDFGAYIFIINSKVATYTREEIMQALAKVFGSGQLSR